MTLGFMGNGCMGVFDPRPGRAGSLAPGNERQGYAVARSYLSDAFAAVHAIKIDGGLWSGGADPGHDGMALAV